METLSRISTSFGRFLSGPDSDLTPAEGVYFDMISSLSALIPLCSGNTRSSASEDALKQIIEATKLGLETMRLLVPFTGGTSVEEIVQTLNSMHQIGVYRDTAIAVSMAVQWILNVNSLNKERDRSGQSGLPKDVVAALKSLQQSADAALKDGKGWIAHLKGSLKSSGDFQKRFTNWVFDEKDEIRDPVYEDIVPGLVANIRENIDGWGQVTWE